MKIFEFQNGFRESGSYTFELLHFFMFESVVLMSVMFFVIILNKPQKGVHRTFLLEIYHSFNHQSKHCSDYQVILKDLKFWKTTFSLRK
jgi:hypothetical protein